MLAWRGMSVIQSRQYTRATIRRGERRGVYRPTNVNLSARAERPAGKRYRSPHCLQRRIGAVQVSETTAGCSQHGQVKYMGVALLRLAV